MVYTDGSGVCAPGRKELPVLVRSMSIFPVENLRAVERGVDTVTQTP